MDYQATAHNLLFFGFTFSLVLAAAQILRPKPELANYLNSAIFLCNGIIQFGIFMISSGVPVRQPLSILAFPSSLFFIGPLIFFYARTLAGPANLRTGLPGRLKLHFLPGVLMLAGEAVFQLQPEECRRSVVDSALNGPEWGAVTFLFLAGAVHMSLYFINILVQGLSVRDIESVRAPLRVMYAVYFACMVSVVLVAGGFFGKSVMLLSAGGAMIPLINSIVFLANYRYPSFFRLIESEIRKKKYEKSLLFWVDTDLLADRLNELMAGRFLYREFDITLEKLSAMLLIKPHQLSQMLNERLGTNFWQYVNSFRIGEAKKLLVENPEQSVISICYHVGFGSKSTFNDIFKKFTGESPSEYRKRAIGSPS